MTAVMEVREAVWWIGLGSCYGNALSDVLFA